MAVKPDPVPQDPAPPPPPPPDPVAQSLMLEVAGGVHLVPLPLVRAYLVADRALLAAAYRGWMRPLQDLARVKLAAIDALIASLPDAPSDSEVDHVSA